MGSKENHKNSVFHAVLCGFESAAPRPRGGVAPQPRSRPPVVAVISRGKYDQLMRRGAAAGMECLCTSGGENNRASLLRGVIRFEALGVDVRREVVLVDA